MSKTKEAATAESKPNVSQFTFSDYSEDATSNDKSDIRGLFVDGFDLSPYQLAFIRHDQHAKAESRYFQKVTKDTHGDWFKPEAFDPIHNVIGLGAEHMHENRGGIPELTLFVRPIEAARAEEMQMSRKSARRLEEDSKLKAIKEKLGNVVGTNILGGVSFARDSWGGTESRFK